MLFRSSGFGRGQVVIGKDNRVELFVRRPKAFSKGRGLGVRAGARFGKGNAPGGTAPSRARPGGFKFGRRNSG